MSVILIGSPVKFELTGNDLSFSLYLRLFSLLEDKWPWRYRNSEGMKYSPINLVESLRLFGLQFLAGLDNAKYG